MHSRIRPFWPRSGAIGVSTTIGAPQATQGLVRLASFICLLLLAFMSEASLWTAYFLYASLCELCAAAMSVQGSGRLPCLG